MAIADWRQIDAVFKRVDRVVWIVTAADGPRRGGLVATFVSQCSVDPEAPLAMVGLAPNHFTAELVAASGAFCLHLLASSQIDLAWRFGLSSGRDGDKFAGLEAERGPSGAPRLPNCLAWLDCRVITRYDAGDRLYFLADVLAGGVREPGTPLTEAGLVAAASPSQRDQLAAGLAADRSLQRPLRQVWRATIERNEPA